MDTQLDTQLSAFVRETCIGREESHGWSHMKKVRDNAMTILASFGTSDLPKIDRCELDSLVLTVAWLHDVPDHKYDIDGTLEDKCLTFLTDELGHTSDTANFIMKIIARISYSKENKARKAGMPIDFDEIFGPYTIVRHIVSDADKIEAIGVEGAIRCAQYTREKNPDISSEDLKTAIIQHYDEKLGLLLNEDEPDKSFIRTGPGMVMARPYHLELKSIISDLDTFFVNHPELLQ